MPLLFPGTIWDPTQTLGSKSDIFIPQTKEKSLIFFKDIRKTSSVSEPNSKDFQKICFTTYPLVFEAV